MTGCKTAFAIRSLAAALLITLEDTSLAKQAAPPATAPAGIRPHVFAYLAVWLVDHARVIDNAVVDAARFARVKRVFAVYARNVLPK